MIIYPLAFPTYTKLTAFMLREKNTVGVTTAPFSGTQQVQEHPGAWWEATFDLRPLTYDLYRQWSSFLSSLHGRAGTFLMGHPLITTTLGSASISGGTPQVNGNNQKGSTLAIKTGLGNLTNYLRAGDLFSIGLGASRRMHKVLYDVSLVGGNAVLDIWPKLRYPPADNALIYFNNPTTQWRLASNVLETTIAGADGGLYRIPTIELVEAL